MATTTIIITTTLIINNSTFLYQNQDDTLNILLPFVVGLFVAIILGWMVMRYKMAANNGIHDATTIQCCPESCLTYFKLNKFRNRRYKIQACF